MMRSNRMLSFLLAVVMVVGMLPVTALAEGFARTTVWQDDLFTDVKQEDWFYENVKGLYELGLMIGYGNGLFQPETSISMAETLTVAARIHATAATGEEDFVQEEPWYQVYADYALEADLIDEEIKDYDRQATRLEFARILARTMSAEDLPPINEVPDGSIPDLKEDEAVYMLYRAGVLMGDDEAGTFRPDADIKRSEVAAIVTRMILPELRHGAQTPDTEPEETTTPAETTEPEATKPAETEPAETQPVVTEPAETQPVVTEPAETQPVVTEPAETQPVVTEPVETQPETGVNVSADIELDETGAVKTEVALEGTDAKAVVPAGVAAQEGAQTLTLSITEMESTTGDIELDGSETLSSYDVHIEGVAADNQVPILVELGMALEPGFNLGNLTLYHVEAGATNPMTQVMTLAEVDEHNEFFYDPATGVLTMALATFSEIAMVSDEPKAWEGNFDYTWYTNAVAPVDGEAVTEYTIANADQLAAFGAIVGGMAADIAQDSFSGKTVKLIADINLGDKDNENENLIFHPIGYYYTDDKNADGTTGDYYSTVKSFEGTFDGNGHTIANFYQNTWEIKGDYDGNYYSDAMGLFGYVVNGTVKNLTVDNFSSDGEFTPTGCVAAYAVNSTFENIALTNCNPRVYNTGNGGIVGIGGNSDDPDTYKLTFNNITIDNSNKITALWGSWDVACGGLVGMFRGAGHVYMTNCHVAAQIDVYNDVCGNYQYYWYRYSGMMVGTNKNMITDDGGYTVPETSKFHAEGCTVHFGEWNDYYYCELVANSLASYTHDHQFSRLEQISSLDEIKSGDTWTKTGNFLLISGDTKTCYHIVKNADGTLKQHLHTDAGEETVNGETVLKENNQIVYLPFNQLFTGYGWGVKHIPIYDDGTPNPFAGVTILGREVATSEVKFEKADAAKDSYTTESTVTIGELFKAAEIDDDNLSIKGDKVQVTVSPVGEDSTVSGIYTANTTDWTKGTLTFSGTGTATITITDYYFCTPTTITVSIYEPQSDEKFTVSSISAQNAYTQITLGTLFAAVDGATIGNVTATVTDPNGNKTTVTGTSSDWNTKTIDLIKDGNWTVEIKDDDKYCTATTATLTVNKVDKFTKKFDKDFRYRVGNANIVELGSLFSEIETTVDISAVNVTIENVEGNAAGTYTSNATWTNGTIKFSGTGVVQVTISAESVNAVTLKLEVVDAVNATGATSATKNNVVLLNDCGFGSLEVSGGYTLYGNGFTMTCGSDSAALDTGYAFVTLNSGTLDNVQIVCPNFDYAVLYKSNMTESGNRSETTDKTRYFNVKSGVMASGNSQILNSRISGARAAVNVSGGNVVIDNSRIELGAVASILVGAANDLTLRDVTLVQEPTASTYDSSKTLMGFSVLFVCDANGDVAPVTLEGTLVQNAWVDENDKKYVPSAGQSIISTVLGKTDYLHDLDGDGTKESLNLGFAYMPESLTSKVNTTTITDNRTNKDAVPYDYAEVSILNGKTYVYSYKNTNGTDDSFKTESDYVPNKYSDIITATYSDTADGLTTGKSYGTDGWVYELNVDLDKLSGYALDFSKLSMSVNGVTVTDFKVNDNAKPTSPVAVTAGGTTYKLTATVNGKEYTATYKVTGTETSKESPTLVAENYEAGLCVASSYGGTWHGAAPALEGIRIKYWSVADKQYKTIDLSAYTPTTPGKQNGTNTTWTYSPANGDFTLTLTGGQVHSSNNVYAMPVVCNGKLYFVAASNKGLVNSGNSARTVPVSYTFKDNNNGDVLTFSHTWSVAENKDAQYSYSDFCNGTLKKLEASSPCFAADTLITLADGTQKRIDALTFEDKILAWDFFTGSYAESEISLLVNHGEDWMSIANMVMSDGSVLRIVGEHGVFDYGLNQFVYITPENVTDYVGHEFVQYRADGTYNLVTLVDGYTTEEYVGYYSVSSAGTSNAFASGLLTVAPPENFYNWIEMGDKLLYNAEQFQQDVETYGLYTYDDFKDYVTYEQFVDWNGAYLKIPVEKGCFTFAYILELIGLYKGWMPNN